MKIVPSTYSQAAEAYRKALDNMRAMSQDKVNNTGREPQDIISIGNKTDFGLHNDGVSKPINAQNISSQDQINKTNILRNGDVIDVVAKAPSAPTFSTFMRTLAKAKVKSLRNAEEYTEKAIEGQASMMEVMAATNEAELILQQVVTLRDKFITSYMEVLRMPL